MIDSEDGPKGFGAHSDQDRISGGGTFAWRSRAATGCESALARMAGKIPRAVGHFANAVSLKSDEADDDQTIKKDFHSHSTMKRLSLIVLFAFATLNTPFAQPQPGAPNPAQASPNPAQASPNPAQASPNPAQASPNPAQASPNPAQAWWAHVQFLADDKMAGRDTGSPEHRKAADYVAAA